MKTTGGIFINLNDSDYSINIEGFTFYFSSKVYLEKFKKKVGDYAVFESEKIATRYNVYINLNLYFMIVLYKKIEKRGFRIYDNDKKIYLSKDLAFINQLICY